MYPDGTTDRCGMCVGGKKREKEKHTRKTGRKKREERRIERERERDRPALVVGADIVVAEARSIVRQSTGSREGSVCRHHRLSHCPE